MLSQKARIFKQLKRGPLSQFWGVNQHGKERILDQPKRISELVQMGCIIDRIKVNGELWYYLKSRPDGLEQTLKADTNISPVDCRNQSGAQAVGFTEQMRLIP